MYAEVPQLFAGLLDWTHYQFNPSSLPHFFAAAAAAAVAIFVLHMEKGSRPAQYFALFCLLFLIWATGRGASMSLLEPELVLFLSRSLFCVVMLVIPTLYHFTQFMVRGEAKRAVQIRIFWGIGIVFALASYSTPWVLSGVRRYAWGYEPLFGVLGLVAVGWIGVLIIMTAVDVWSARQAAPEGSKERHRLNWFGFAMLVLYCCSIEFLPGLGVEVFPMASGPLICFTGLSAYLTYKYGFVEVTPELAAREIIEHLQGALLMLDTEGVIQFANRHCETTLGVGADRAVGRSAKSLLGDNFDIGRLRMLAAPGNSDLEKEWTHADLRSGQARELAMSAFAVLDGAEREAGYVCMLRDLTEQRRKERERRSSIQRDALTTLPNRNLFMGDLDAAIRRGREDGGSGFSVYFIALQRMRVINEELGFGTGDRVLVEVARRLKKRLGPADSLARVGGDEFALYQHGDGDAAKAREFAEHLLEAIRVPMVARGESLHMDASIGIASSTRGYTNGPDLLRDASIATYRAKEKPERIELVGAVVGSGRRTQTEAELRRALVEKQLGVHYQPIIDLGRGCVAGYEALVRWRHPERGLVRPDAFLPLAEEVGLMAEIDRMVLTRACLDLAELQHRADDPTLSVSVNLSEAILGQKDFAETVINEIAGANLESLDLRIELLERIAQLDQFRDTLEKLRRAGVGLYVDDFGTGYSALSRLHETPVTALKIDRAFIRSLTRDDGGRKVVSAILSLADNLGLGSVAEGVTTADELAWLREAGCRHAQGFYFAKALPLEEALAWTLDRRRLEKQLAAA